MNRIQGTLVVVDDNGNNIFGCGDPNAQPPISPTPTTVVWGNGMQEEIMGIIEQLGLTPDIEDNNQAIKAIKAAYEDSRYATPVLAHMLGDTVNPNFALIDYTGVESIPVATGAVEVLTKAFGWAIDTNTVQHNSVPMTFVKQGNAEMTITGTTSAAGQSFNLISLKNRSTGTAYGKNEMERAPHDRTFMLKSGFLNEAANQVHARPYNELLASDMYGGSHTIETINTTAIGIGDYTTACSIYTCTDFGGEELDVPITPMCVEFTVKDAGPFQIVVKYADFIPVLSDTGYVPDTFPLIALDAQDVPVEPEDLPKVLTGNFLGPVYDRQNYTGVNVDTGKYRFKLTEWDLREYAYPVLTGATENDKINMTAGSIFTNSTISGPTVETILDNNNTSGPRWLVTDVSIEQYNDSIAIYIEVEIAGSLGVKDGDFTDNIEFQWSLNYI